MPGCELNDETTEWLLPADRKKDDVRKTPTPLPKLQIAVLLFFQLAEPITSQCIYPFINQLVSELEITGGDDRKVGYYAGLIESLFFATEAMFVLQWSRASDRIGRKPVLLIGVAGLCVSMLLFGLSRTFMGLVLSRCLVGMLNGNLGVIKSMMAELTDETNMAQGYALMPVMWSIGGTVGPFIGGVLSKPHERWPELFADPFWVKYPYFLPCGAASAFSGFVFLVTAILLKETVKKPPTKPLADPEDFAPGAPGKPLPMRALLTYPVLLSVANYALLAMLDIAYRAIQPLFFATPIALGGLGQPPARIGAILASFGLANGVFQATCFARLIDRWGPRRLFLLGMSMFAVLYSIFPLVNHIAREAGKTTPLVWALVALQLALTVTCDMAYGCIFMYVNASAPNRQSLGATNGISQLAASVVRAIGPALSTSLFAASAERDWLGGRAVYVILVFLCACVLLVGRKLPAELWNR